MTFKELKKRISDSSNQQQQQTHSFDKLQNKPFWIWNIEEHKLEDIRTKEECCFNHIIGLPTKDKEDNNKEPNEPDYDDDGSCQLSEPLIATKKPIQHVIHNRNQ